MFLPATYVTLHLVMENAAQPGQPLEAHIKPDQILAMVTRNGTVKVIEQVNGQGVEQTKQICVTQITIPFAEPLIVQEPPDIIRKLIVDAFNNDLRQAGQMQTGGLLIAGGSPIPAPKRHN